MSNENEMKSCVFYFFNEEDYHLDLSKRKTIYKLLPKDIYTQNELTNIKKVMEIPHYYSLYYICDHCSELNITEYNPNSNYLRSCKDIRKDNTILLKYKNIDLIYFKTYLKSLNRSRKYISFIMNSYKTLLHSIDLLVKQNLVHNYIKSDSIIVSNHEVLLTNFSFSINTSNKDLTNYIKLFYNTYEPSYLEWPIEIHILSYLLTNKLNSLSIYNIETVINDYVLNHSILKTFGPTFVSSYRSESIQYFTNYVNQSYLYILNDVLSYSGTWDNYALSILYLRILIDIHHSIKIQNKFIILFMKLLVNNIHLNPFKRDTVENTIIKFEYIIDTINTFDYKQLIDNLMFS